MRMIDTEQLDNYMTLCFVASSGDISHALHCTVREGEGSVLTKLS